MSDNLYAQIPDLGAYLARIGVDEAEDPTIELLDKLIISHQRTIPFDDLDTYALDIVPSLGIGDLFEKIVMRRRGGYCFELNALFGALLKAFGYQTRPYMARVLTRPVPHPLISHRANFVRIDGKDYIADVGFGGPQPSFGVLLEDGVACSKNGQTFTTHKRSDDWWELGYTHGDGEEQMVQAICMATVGEEDFVPLSYYQATNPASVFRSTRMVNIKTEDGAINLRGSTLTTFKNGERTDTEIAEEDVDQLLAKTFGIVNWR